MIFSSLKVWREMMPEVDSFNPFIPSQNRSGPPRSFSQYYEGALSLSSCHCKGVQMVSARAVFESTRRLTQISVLMGVNTPQQMIRVYLTLNFFIRGEETDPGTV